MSKRYFQEKVSGMELKYYLNLGFYRARQKHYQVNMVFTGGQLVIKDTQLLVCKDK